MERQTSFKILFTSLHADASSAVITDIKQLLDEVEHDIKNYQSQGLRLRQITQTRGFDNS